MIHSERPNSFPSWVTFLLLVVFILGAMFVGMTNGQAPEDVLSEITTASAGMQAVSEYNSVVVPYMAPQGLKGTALTEKTFRRAANIPASAVLVQSEPDQLFERQMASYSANVGGWQFMQDLMQARLDAISVFRTGGIHGRYYVVGVYENRVIGITFEATES